MSKPLHREEQDPQETKSAVEVDTHVRLDRSAWVILVAGFVFLVLITVALVRCA